MKTKKEIKKLSKKYWDKQPYNEDAYFEGYNQCQKDVFEEAELKDWDVTLNDGLENEPYVSDDFQIGPDGAYEHTEDWPEELEEQYWKEQCPEPFATPEELERDGAHEHDTTSREKAKSELINLLLYQIMDLTTMSKIELGDDVIAEIKRLKDIIKIGEQEIEKL